MCGITAVVVRSEGFAQSLPAMNDAIRHRGPDDEGFVLIDDSGYRSLGGRDTPESAFHDDSVYAPVGSADDTVDWSCRVAFGHRRLSIVDPSARGHQPLCDAAARYWITYNGEIYNHAELRKELEASGWIFRSRTDTEVIVAAYARWGHACLDRFNGMWGFVIYDRHERKLFAARDRFGVKPLYYWKAPGGSICLVSEIKQLTRAQGWQARVNGQRAYDFLVWGVMDHTEETLFEGVYQLQPGHFIEQSLADLECDAAGRLGTRQWYAIGGREFTGSLDDAASKFRDLFTDAVRVRLRADVPVGSCLSGGLDSSSIVCVANRMLRDARAEGSQRTFSAHGELPQVDESDWIGQVVEATGVEAHAVTPSLDGVLADISELTWHQDEPFGSTGIYAQWAVFRLASSEGVKVMLDGQGADEHLAGYHTFFGPRLTSLWRTDGVVGCVSELRRISRRHGYPVRRLLAQLANHLLPHPVRRVAKRWSGFTHDQPDWLSLDALGAQARDPLREGRHYGGSVYAHSVSQLSAAGIRKLLHWEDRNSMAFSLESRVPFLDYRLVEFCLGLPDSYKIGNATTKRVLRLAMRGILPERVRTRVDKLGFATPESNWFVDDREGTLKTLLQRAVDRSHGALNDRLLSRFDAMRAGRRRFDHVPWRAISYAAWLERFDVSA